MERRSARVSEAQWSILLEFLERNPSLARVRGYNNSSRGRAESSRHWQEVANILNAEGSGTAKTPKEWSIYVSNYKSKLRRIVADINPDASGTGGGPPGGSSLSELDHKFLALLGLGFGQTAPSVSVDPFPNENLQQPSTSNMPQTLDVVAEADEPEIFEQQISPSSFPPPNEVLVDMNIPADGAALPLPRRTRQTRYRSRPLAPLDEARRILSQVEMQRAAADADAARALDLIGHNLGRLASVFENSALDLIGQNLGRLADAVERHLSQSRPS